MYTEQQASYLVEESSKIIRLFYECEDTENNGIQATPSAKNGELIKKLCTFFDNVKNFELNQAQLKLLYKMSNIVGIPQYYDMLMKYRNGEPTIEEWDIRSFTDLLYNCSLYVDQDKSLHKYQKQIIDKYKIGEQNRYFLSAPTSFGKTFIITEIIKKMQYNDIALIFPTLSLLAENYARLLNDKHFSGYRIHTLSNFDFEQGSKNIWIYTPERFMTMTDKYKSITFDFVFMDEVYKIDNQFILDNETVGENERDTSFRIALSITCKRAKDFLLAGPYINIPDNNQEYPIINFLRDNNIANLSYNNIEIVDKEIISITENSTYHIDKVGIPITNKNKNKRLNAVIRALNMGNNGSIVYVKGRGLAETTAGQIAKTREALSQERLLMMTNISQEEKENFMRFVVHLKSNFSSDWIIVKCLYKRIGVHHGYIPKYIQKEIIHFFNVGILDCIVSTTTITEGVNTSAKNMIVMSDEKGNKPLKKFDAQNIAGRAGRFFYHYKGRVVAIDNKFQDILAEPDEYLNHADYDKSKDKTEIDIMISDDKYLTANDKKTKQELLKEASELGICKDIIDEYKSIPLRDKIVLYKAMLGLTQNENDLIQSVVKKLYLFTQLDWDGFEVLLRYILPIVKNDSLQRMIVTITGPKRKYCVLTVKVNSYIERGFNGIYDYEKNNGKKPDAAVRKAAELSFNLFRYHLVKYLGIFDLIYRHLEAARKSCSVDDVAGLSILLQMLEFNSKTADGKIVSDYGVPFNVLHYIDTHNQYLKSQMDIYETDMLRQIKELFDIE